jgi:hypothetical protein
LGTGEAAGVSGAFGMHPVARTKTRKESAARAFMAVGINVKGGAVG